MRRFVLLMTACFVVMAAIGTDGSMAARASAAAQRKAPPKKGRGVRVVDGALWDFIATNGKADQQIRFRYRASNLVLYDADTDKLIGKVEEINEGSRVVFNDKSRFPATFTIRKQGGGVWKGSAKYKDEDWAVEVRRLTPG